MAGITQTVATLNSAVRTLLALVAAGVIGVVGWFGYTAFDAGGIALRERDEQIEQLRGELADNTELLRQSEATIQQQSQRIDQMGLQIEEQKEQIAALDAALTFLKVDRRLARIRVVEQGENEQGELQTTVEFTELDEAGEPLGPPIRFPPIRGDIVYVEYLVVKFEDRLVELGETMSICAFRRVYGEYMEPQAGYAIDRSGTRPGAYGSGGAMSAFERDVWRDFWQIANNPQRAESLGIRAAHGEAPFVQVQPGKSYRLTLRASGGLTIVAEEGEGNSEGGIRNSEGA